MSASWADAADAFESLLDRCDRLAGGIDTELPEMSDFALTGTPDAGTLSRLQSLLARKPLTEAMLGEQISGTAEEIRQVQRLREVGYRYLAF